MLRIFRLSAAVLAIGAGSVSAASAGDSLRIRFGDLDLTSRSGAQALDGRIRQAARTYCAVHVGVRRSECRVAVTTEVLRAMPEQARADYAVGRRSFDV